MAPGARLVPIKVFDTPETDWASIYPAMAYLISHVQPGDVVNVSFGGPWDPSAGGNPRMIERQLRRLADQGVRVSVAAGNLDALPDSAYVQTVSPARAGAYRNEQAGGAVMTASAIDGEGRFWPESGFGNGEASRSGGLHLGPPDVAEPGVAIPVLWPGGQMRACTGTSFAAPHLAAILFQGLPDHDGQAKGDISATIERPRGPLTDAARNDPIGVCLRNAKDACEVR
jgi:subtilisin family serine protease